MSNAVTPTWPQANHTLTLIGQQNPTMQQLRQLHDGPLSDLMQAIANGTLPDRDEVRKFYGLPLFHPEVFDLTINYSLTRSQMMDAARLVGRSGFRIEEFVWTGVGVVELEARLFYPRRTLGTSLTDFRQLLGSVDSTNPWEFSRLEHLLSFRAAGHLNNLDGPVLSLGSLACCFSPSGADESFWTPIHGTRPCALGHDVRFLGVRPKKIP